MDSKVIALANQKGGVSKTTTTANLGIGLANAGKKVLLIDLDPQASLTISLGYPKPEELPCTITDLMIRSITNKPICPEDALIHHEEGVYYEIIPLKLSSTEGYNIYYTLDGSEPTRDSIQYTEPIFLDDGIYEFRAICMNEYGVTSDVVTKKYEIIFADK